MLSIVIATWARLPQLQRCIANIRAGVSIQHEIIVVGAGDGDGTESWALQQPDIRFIAETRREGATRAYNKGFRAARGDYVTWLNDDSYPLPGALEAARGFLAAPDAADVGMVALYHDYRVERNRLDTIVHGGEEYAIYHVRGVPYANFGLLRRELLARVGYLDERYYFCAWDPDLALKVQREAGRLVVGCRAARVRHEELIDARKQADLAIAERDNALLFTKWGLPPSGAYADPRQAYAALLAQRGWDERRVASSLGESAADLDGTASTDSAAARSRGAGAPFRVPVGSYGC